MKYHVTIEHAGDPGLGGGVWSGFTVEADSPDEARVKGEQRMMSEHPTIRQGRRRVEPVLRYRATFQHRKDRRKRETFIVEGFTRGMAEANARYCASQSRHSLDYRPVRFEQIADRSTGPTDRQEDGIMTIDEIRWAEARGDRFAVATHPGIAFYFLAAETRPDEDTVWTGFEEETGMAVMVMVGDDRRHAVDPEDVSALSEPVCSCGQIGCCAEVGS